MGDSADMVIDEVWGIWEASSSRYNVPQCPRPFGSSDSLMATLDHRWLMVTTSSRHFMTSWPHTQPHGHSVASVYGYLIVLHIWYAHCSYCSSTVVVLVHCTLYGTLIVLSITMPFPCSLFGFLIVFIFPLFHIRTFHCLQWSIVHLSWNVLCSLLFSLVDRSLCAALGQISTATFPPVYISLVWVG